MPNTKSAIKRLRRDEKARVRNRSQQRTMKTAIKKCRLSVSLGSEAGMVETSFRKMQSYVAKASRKGIIPKGRGKRIISRMALLRKMEIMKSS